MNTSISDKYQIERLIGNGTFSAVFKAREKTSDRTVAIKALYRGTYKKGAIKYLEAETKIMGLLWGHPNIVSIHTVEPGDEDYIAYIVMEYVGGPNLGELIKQRNGIFSLEDIICIGIGICNGLSIAHSHNIVHRDIKPKNILLTKDLSVKLSDFSIAQILEESGGYKKDTAGTRRYMAPEQYTGNYDYRVDIYATGLILLEMSIGHLPFAGLTSREIERKKKTEEINIPDSVPSGLQPILQKATQRDVKKRYQIIDDLRDDLDRIRLKLYEHYVKALIEQDLSPIEFNNSLRKKQAQLRLPTLVASNIERDVENDLKMYQYHLNKREIEEQSKHHYQLAKQYLLRKKIGDALSEIREIVLMNIVDERQAELIDELYSEFTDILKSGTEQFQPIKTDINEYNYLRFANFYERTLQYEKVAETFIIAAEIFENSGRIRNAKKCYKKAANFYKEQATNLYHSDSLEKAAQCYQKSAQAYENIESYWKARRVYEKAAESYERFAEIFEITQKWGMAGNYFFKAVELYQKAQKAKKVNKIRKKTVFSYLKKAQELYSSLELDGAYKYCYSALRISVHIKESYTFSAEARKLLETIESALRSRNMLIPPINNIQIED